MHNKNSTSYRLIAFALALVLTLGLLPITPAKAATGNGNDLIVEVDTTGSSVQEMKMVQIANPTLMGRKNGRWSKSVSDWFATFTDKAGNKGFGYCNDHSKPAPNNGRGATMTIKPSSMKGNVALKNVLFLGYDGSERGPNYAVSHLRKWCVSLYGPATVGDWSGLTDGEFQKATQLAFWMLASGEGAAKPQVSIEGQYGEHPSASGGIFCVQKYLRVPLSCYTAATFPHPIKPGHQGVAKMAGFIYQKIQNRITTHKFGIQIPTNRLENVALMGFSLRQISEPNRPGI